MRLRYIIAAAFSVMLFSASGLCQVSTNNNTLADLYAAKYGVPKPNTEGLPDWLTDFLSRQTKQPSASPNYSGGSWPKSEMEVARQLLFLFPRIEGKLANSNEERALMKRAVEYLHEEIAYLFVLEIDEVLSHPSNEKLKQKLLIHLETISKLAAL